LKIGETLDRPDGQQLIVRQPHGISVAADNKLCPSPHATRWMNAIRCAIPTAASPTTAPVTGIKIKNLFSRTVGWLNRVQTDSGNCRHILSKG
jgi:hypothetical protein